MDHAGDGRARAGADVGGGAGDGAGGGNAAEERRDNVGDALCDELHVGVVVVAAHAVGDDGGEKAFDRGEHGDGEGRGQQGRNVGGVEAGQGEVGKAAGNAAELGADGFDGQMEDGGDGGGEQQGDDGAGDSAGDARPEQDDGERGRQPRATVCQRMVATYCDEHFACAERNSLGTGGVAGRGSL